MTNSGWMGPALIAWITACADGGGRPHATDSTDTALVPEPTSKPGFVAGFSAAPLWNDHPLMKQLTVDLVGPAPVEVQCVSPDDPLEDHFLESTASQVQHQLDLYGLLADTTYACTATAVDASGATHTSELTFRTATLPARLLPTTTLEKDGSESRYVLFNHMRYFGNGEDIGSKLLIFDADGNLRWYHVLADDDGGANIGLEFNWVAERQEALLCGGDSIAPKLMSLKGEVSWQVPLAVDQDLNYHHDCVYTQEGHIVALKVTKVVLEGEDLDGTEILEFDPANNVLFSWSTQQGIDQGAVDATEFGLYVDVDPWHANAVSWAEDSEGPAAYLSHKDTNEILRIDRNTGAVTWNLRDMGPFRLVDTSGVDLESGDWFKNQHGTDFRMEADGLHGLFYDNGAGGTNQTGVMEFRIDAASGEAVRLWRYIEPAWYTPLWGDADWLDDGKILVARGYCFNCNGAEPNERSQIMLLDPLTSTVSWRLSFGDLKDAIYRAQVVDPCQMFSNRRYCAPTKGKGSSR